MHLLLKIVVCFWLLSTPVIGAESYAWKIAESLGPLTEAELNGLTPLERMTTPSTAYVFEKGLKDTVDQDVIKAGGSTGERIAILGYLVGVARRCEGLSPDFSRYAVKNIELAISDLQSRDLGKWLKLKTSILRAQTRGEKSFSGKLLPSYQSSLCPAIIGELGKQLDMTISVGPSVSLLDQMTKRVASKWARPKDYYDQSKVAVKVILSRDGSVKAVEFLDDDADVGFKKSVLNAVFDASPFNEVLGVDDSTFTEKYSSLTIRFLPE